MNVSEKLIFQFIHLYIYTYFCHIYYEINHITNVDVLHISMVNAIRISVYGNSLYHSYMLQINANAFMDLHRRYGSWISANGNGPLL